jgi:diguanylate cyclase (GGDEF)-like protein
MIFPNMHEIATRDVVTVDSKMCLKDAIEVLKKSNHTNIIVVSNKDYYLFSTNDIIKIKFNDNNLDMILEDISLTLIPMIDKQATVLDGMSFVNDGIKLMCVVEEDSSLFGIVTNSDIISSIDPETLMDNITIKDYFKKSATIHYIDKDKTILEALSIIEQGESDCVIVSDNNFPEGILTSKDVISILSNNINLEYPVNLFCSSPLQTISENFTIKEAIDYVNKKHFKRVVTVDGNGKISSIISQQELISYSYNHWANMMKNYHDKLLSLNIELKEKSDKLQLMATTDMLTKLYNRYMFSELFHKFLENKKRDREDKLLLALIDIDNFKGINDTYGHNVGDEVLKNIANLLLTSLRSSDISARWGGEEFIVLLTNTDMEIGFSTIDRLREAISNISHPFDGKVTVSIGVTEVNETDTLQSSVKRADDALYKSKENGKNRVKIGWIDDRI